MKKQSDLYRPFKALQKNVTAELDKRERRAMGNELMVPAIEAYRDTHDILEVTYYGMIAPNLTAEEVEEILEAARTAHKRLEASIEFLLSRQLARVEAKST